MSRRIMRTSSHRLADALRARPDLPLRGITAGKLLIARDGKPDDDTKPVSFEELMGGDTETADGRGSGDADA